MIIAVFGSSGAGKTYLLNEALKSGFSLKNLPHLQLGQDGKV